MRNRITVSDRSQQRLPVFDRHQRDRVKESKLRLIFHGIWQWWLTELRASNDPKIWQTTDPWGNTWWHAYNPATGYSATRESEIEILEWIEKRIIDE